MLTTPELLSTSMLGLSVWVMCKVIKAFFSPKNALKNIPGPPSDSYLKGHFDRLFGFDAPAYHREVLENYGQVANVKCPFGESKILISDPKALHHIMIKDQHVYEMPPWFTTSIRVIFGPGLLGTCGATHRKQRKMLNPVFSVAQLREFVPIFYGVTLKLRDAIAKKVGATDGQQEIDVVPWLARTALELIGQSGFGYSFDTLTDHGVSHSFAVSVKQIDPVLSKMLFPRIYLFPLLSEIGTRRFQRFVVDHIPWNALKEVTKFVDSIHNTSLEIFESKKRALAEGNEVMADEIAEGKDMMSVLLRGNMQAEKDDRLSDKELTGQVSTMTFAAIETTSSVLCRILSILSERQDSQEKLRAELCKAKTKHGDFNYDVLHELPYLEAICRESLRLYPPVPGLTRTTRNTILLPLGTPIIGRDGREMSEIIVPKGTDLVISIVACNTNPDIWGADSYEWRPERWLEPLPGSVTSARLPGVCSNLMTFSAGGRSCIGFKFSQLEIKVVLSVLIESFKISRSNKEIEWKSLGIMSPFVKDEKLGISKLPLVFERIG